MSNKFKNNKHEQAIDELTKFCKECKGEKSTDCFYNRECEKYNLKFNELYYDLAYPLDPCKDCIVLTQCREPSKCEEFNQHYNIRDVAKSELLGYQIYFSKKKKKLFQGHSELITEEDIIQKYFSGEKIDIEFTKEYIKEIKNEKDYNEILKIEKQRLEYFHSYKFINDERGQCIIDTDNTNRAKHMGKAEITYDLFNHLKN